MMFCLVDFSLLYVDAKSAHKANSLSRVYGVHEIVGFVHAAIEPMILYMVLAGASKKESKVASLSNHSVTRREQSLLDAAYSPIKSNSVDSSNFLNSSWRDKPINSRNRVDPNASLSPAV